MGRATVIAVLVLAGCHSVDVESSKVELDAAPAVIDDGPAGAWRMAWRCIGGCATYQPPTLVAASRVDVVAGALVWSVSSNVVADHEAASVGLCRRTVADPDTGRGTYDLCVTGDGVRIDIVSWYDPATQWRQTWEATGER